MRPRLGFIALAGVLALALALTAVNAATGLPASRHVHHGPTITDLGELWAIPPIEVAAILVGGAVYAVAVARHPGTVPAWSRWSFAGGLALLLAAVCSPLAGMAQQGVLAAHMLQHVVIGAIAPMLLGLGLTSALAREVLSVRGRRRLEALQHPAFAFPLWVGTTVVLLLPAVHHVLLHEPAAWVAQQAAFFVTGMLLWAPVMEQVPAPSWFSTAWKGGYMSGVFLVGLVIANVYWWSGTAFYGSHAEAAIAWGVDPLQDQANSGTIMILVHCMLAFGAVAVLFFRQAREGDLRQRLIEAGIEPERVELAIRAGGAEALARSRGISTTVRPGID